MWLMALLIFMIWWMIGIATMGIVLASQFKQRGYLEVGDCAFALGYSFLGPITTCGLIVALIEDHAFQEKWRRWMQVRLFDNKGRDE